MPSSCCSLEEWWSIVNQSRRLLAVYTNDWHNYFRLEDMDLSSRMTTEGKRWVPGSGHSVGPSRPSWIKEETNELIIATFVFSINKTVIHTIIIQQLLDRIHS